MRKGEAITDRAKELQNTTFVKTILMFVIVFYHSVIFLNGKWFSPAKITPSLYASYLLDWLNSFHVYAFTLASGYLFFHIRHERGGYDRFLPFAVNKFKRLIIPYCFVSAVWAVPIYVYFFKPGMRTVIKNFVLGENPNHLWFLLMLFGVFLIAWPLSGLFRRKYSFVIPLLFFFLAHWGWSICPDNFFHIWSVFRYLSFFYLGFKIRQGWDRAINKLPSWMYFLLHMILFVSRKYLETYGRAIPVLADQVLDLLMCTAGALMAWRLLQDIGNAVNWQTSKTFAFFSEKSMVVYLFHQQIIYFSIYFLSALINPVLLIGINFIAAMGLSVLIAALFLRFNILRPLVGEKPVKKKTA